MPIIKNEKNWIKKFVDRYMVWERHLYEFLLKRRNARDSAIKVKSARAFGLSVSFFSVRAFRECTLWRNRMFKKTHLVFW